MHNSVTSVELCETTAMSSKILKGPELKHVVNFSMGDFYFNNCERFGDRICQIDATHDKKETYHQVKQKSVRTALELQKRGITSEDVILLCTKVTLDNIIPILASFYLGAKLGNLDPSLSVRQITHLLSTVTPRVIFVEEDSVALIEESLKIANLQATIVVFGESKEYSTFCDFIKPHPNEDKFKPPKVNIHDIAIIFFSSGTTGLAKAICHSHVTFLSMAYSIFQAGYRSDSVLSFTSFYWVSASMLLACSFLVGGHRIFLSAMDAENTLRAIEKYKISSLFLAPVLTYKLTSFERWQEFDISSVNSVLTGGTPISSTQFQRIGSMFKRAIINFVYGLSEAGLVTIFDNKNEIELTKTKVGSCGKAAPGVSIKVIDLESGSMLGPNKKGEIYVKAPSLMKGYYKTSSAQAFDSEMFLKTGDIGYYDEDECFYVIERIKEMFKYLSWHIIPSAVEAVLLEHPNVKEAVVFGTPINEEEGEAPTACVVLKDEHSATEKEIQDFVAARVSDYEKIRGGVIFAKELQKTPSGKIMRKEMRMTILKL